MKRFLMNLADFLRSEDGPIAAEYAAMVSFWKDEDGPAAVAPAERLNATANRNA